MITPVLDAPKTAITPSAMINDGKASKASMNSITKRDGQPLK